MIEEKAKYRKLLAKRSPTKLVEVLRETLETMDFVVFAYLYGSLLSWLKGSTLPPGDVDLAIYTEESIPAPKADKDARLYDFMEKNGQGETPTSLPGGSLWPTPSNTYWLGGGVKW